MATKKPVEPSVAELTPFPPSSTASQKTSSRRSTDHTDHSGAHTSVTSRNSLSKSVRPSLDKCSTKLFHARPNNHRPLKINFAPPATGH